MGAPIKPPGGPCLRKLVAFVASFPSAVPEGEVKESQSTRAEAAVLWLQHRPSPATQLRSIDMEMTNN